MEVSKLHAILLLWLLGTLFWDNQLEFSYWIFNILPYNECVLRIWRTFALILYFMLGIKLTIRQIKRIVRRVKLIEFRRDLNAHLQLLKETVNHEVHLQLEANKLQRINSDLESTFNEGEFLLSQIQLDIPSIPGSTTTRTGRNSPKDEPLRFPRMPKITLLKRHRSYSEGAQGQGSHPKNVNNFIHSTPSPDQINNNIPRTPKRTPRTPNSPRTPRTPKTNYAPYPNEPSILEIFKNRHPEDEVTSIQVKGTRKDPVTTTSSGQQRRQQNPLRLILPDQNGQMTRAIEEEEAGVTLSLRNRPIPESLTKATKISGKTRRSASPFTVSDVDGLIGSTSRAFKALVQRGDIKMTKK